MAIQGGNGKIGFREDFAGIGAAATISDATAGTRWNDITLIAISGDVAMTHLVTESGGIAQFSGAAGAADGIVLTSSPMRPSTNGTLVVGGRFKASAVTDYRAFLGFQETVSLSETVNPFTLSGTTLTDNDGGEAVGFYYDTAATVDDFRFLSSSAGVADTSAALSFGLNGETTLGALGVRANTTLAADSWMMFRVELDNDGACRGYLGTAGMAKQNGLTLVASIKAGALSPTAFYHPIMHLLESSTGDPLHSVDFFFAEGNRSWAA